MEKIEDLQKACFLNARTVRDYFANARGVNASTEEIYGDMFANAIHDLDLGWPTSVSEQIFD